MDESNQYTINNNTNSNYKYIISLEDRARNKLIKRYNKPLSYHDVKIINDILYNEKTHYVEAFKEYLIYEDYNEFLKRFYTSYEISKKLPKILIFYEKYSKIYANYTVIPESKYMYKNIRKKQKMIDQMQNNDINSEYEDDEESNEDMSNTIFSSKVINSIYRRTLSSSLNKSSNSKNTEQSINGFLEKINNIEKDVKNKENSKNKQHNKKMRNNFLTNNNNKTPPKTIKTNNNNNHNNKVIDIQINYTKTITQKKNSNFQNKNNNLNHNANKNNYNNLIFINSYTYKTKNDINTFKNNSLGNYIKSYNNTFNKKNLSNNINNNTFNGQAYLITNSYFPKQKKSTSTLKKNIINKSNNNISEQKSNMSLTNINNNFTNINNNMNNNQKYKFSLRETLFKLDKLILSTNASNSPRLLNENPFITSSNKTNIFNTKNILKHPLIKKKEKSESQKIKKDIKGKTQGLSSHKIMNTKKIRSNILYNNYNSLGTNLTFFSNNKLLEKNKIKNIYNKYSKKKSNNKYNEKISSNNNKKPETHRNCYHSRILSGNNSCQKNKNNIVNMISNNNNNKKTVGNNKKGIKIDHKKLSFPCSPYNSSTNFHFKSQITSRKSSLNKKKNLKLIKETNKKKVINNFNIVNNIHDNSTQINIFTSKDLYKSLRLQNKSLFNSSSISPSNISPKSPNYNGTNKNKKQLIINKNILENNNANKTYLKSNIKGKEKLIKHNLDFKKILSNKNLVENDKGIISERLANNNNKKIFEKLGKYFFKNKKEKGNNNSKKINAIKKINNSNKNINFKYKNNEYSRIINKIINHKSIKNKTNNNTPIKTRYIRYNGKNHIKVPSICLSPTDYSQLIKVNKKISGNNVNYNNLVNNLYELKNFGIEDGNKLFIHSERNKISKIEFK